MSWFVEISIGTGIENLRKRNTFHPSFEDNILEKSSPSPAFLQYNTVLITEKHIQRK